MQFIIAGVGGQGILFASRVLGHVALSRGLHVNGSEVHGMSQRGGSVISHFKVGDYKAGCEYFLKYRFSQGKDCFLPENARVCGGIKKRREYEYRLCMGLI